MAIVGAEFLPLEIFTKKLLHCSGCAGISMDQKWHSDHGQQSFFFFLIVAPRVGVVEV